MSLVLTSEHSLNFPLNFFLNLLLVLSVFSAVNNEMLKNTVRLYVTHQFQVE
jgi:hypothetical protein